MKLSIPLIFGAITVASASPASEANLTINGTLIPQEAIISGLTIPEDVYPILNYENNTATVVFLNGTLLAEAKAYNSETKRDVAYPDREITKRDVEPHTWSWGDADHELASVKREAEAEAEADPWHWVRLKIGQPFFKRDAEGSADPWRWVSLTFAKPFFKRDAEASADPWHWVALKIGQPFF
ncbi:hypothetical protein METBIDRAFT_40901 [Metschnikowia bicuspidata var. bicuspidata NRRL YB-4993]|uniref:Mating factor alpha precursor N-terminal domain-containing protein n=1 Tax=Metschnikowia bicuspidata var. bicuspidata NRRL YB-4993 TaxID=869754 RepID=A0A1A0HB32_9ASCO|nr:hypothetical protein METBIDRAFT_40901 [Metschnikowia bicuspidata var. bicuspidata NRRL YB-4993]OBA21098.1 hypothetical protein METBIDRAFT_40901 [Metschnikowia bicuspidata var. bicuspidata NRRL YB-4993]